jgi:hypothetical protein
MPKFLEGLTLAEIEDAVEADEIDEQYGEWLIEKLIGHLDF